MAGAWGSCSQEAKSCKCLFSTVPLFNTLQDISQGMVLPTVGRSSYLKFSGHDQNETRFLAKIITQIGSIQAPDKVLLFFETLESLSFCCEKTLAKAFTPSLKGVRISSVSQFLGVAHHGGEAMRSWKQETGG